MEENAKDLRRVAVMRITRHLDLIAYYLKVIEKIDGKEKEEKAQ